MEFSKKAKEEMKIFGDAVEDILDRSVRAFVEHDIELSVTVEPLEEVINDLNKKVKKRHLKRLQKGKCTMELGLVLSDAAANYERVADHCSNLALYIIQMEDDSIEAHDYINTLTEENREQFEQLQAAYKEKYQIS